MLDALTIKDLNRSIGLFIGGRIIEELPTENTYMFCFDKECPIDIGDIKSEDGRMFTDHLHFHESWNWLMPVYRKCIDAFNELKDESFELTNVVNLMNTSITQNARAPYDLWLFVAQFIKGYNNRKLD